MRDAFRERVTRRGYLGFSSIVGPR